MALGQQRNTPVIPQPAQCNFDNEYVFIILNETELANWSFGKGIAQIISGKEGSR